MTASLPSAIQSGVYFPRRIQFLYFLAPFNNGLPLKLLPVFWQQKHPHLKAALRGSTTQCCFQMQGVFKER
jgi:hypothetical protein